ELWVALAEKAYAQVNESGWIGQNNTNSYQGIEGGWDGYALNHITGVNTGYYNFFDLNSMVGYFQSGNWMSVSSKVTGVGSSIVPNHSYLVVDYNSATQQFTLFNPWGVDGAKDGNGVFKPGTLKVNYSQLIANFDGWTWAAV
ncbi:MAG: peptidase C2 calpain, partial [Coleofasciculus sp. Co-bin14]|nr:peptidase C2 calpain [Coleofasciculus sp. Co-bin14]